MKKTRKTIEYLNFAKVNHREMFALLEAEAAKMRITPHTLARILLEDGLEKRGTQSARAG